MTRISLQLALGQTAIWGGIFYLFPALLLVWQNDMGWTKGPLTGAYTLALLVAALASPIVGRLIDQGYGKRLMIGGAIAAAVLLVALSQVQLIVQFYIVWIGLGLCMAACLYEPCFAILTRAIGPKAKGAITKITLIAGLAGTIAFPTANILAANFGWRAAVLCFAAAIVLIYLPLTLSAVTSLERLTLPIGAAQKIAPRSRLVAGKTFWLLAFSFFLISIHHGMLITHLLPLLSERDVTLATALFAVSMFGAMQVIGRLVMLMFERHSSTFGTALACFAGMGLGTIILIFAGANTPLITAFVILQGAAYGVTSIVRPVITRELLGDENFGQISGRIGGLFMFGTAVAPFGGTLIWQWHSYQMMLALSAAGLFLGTLLLILAVKR